MEISPWIRNAAWSGALVAVATTLAVAARGRRRGSALAPVNATSHVLWGDAAADETRFTGRHTVPGVLINAGACAFWAAIYEWAFGRRASAAARALGGPVVAGIAYVTDYHLVPRRLTPGWELRLTNADLGVVYAALAVALPMRALAQPAR